MSVYTKCGLSEVKLNNIKAWGVQEQGSTITALSLPVSIFNVKPKCSTCFEVWVLSEASSAFKPVNHDVLSQNDTWRAWEALGTVLKAQQW